MSDAAGPYGAFLEELEALGLTRGLDDELPPDFTAVYDIGRVLADPRSELGAALRPALALVAPLGDVGAPVALAGSESLVEVPAAEEYEAEFIRSWSDVPYVYSWQHLLPEEVFLRRLAARTLWFPMAKAPRIRAVEGGEDDFSPTPSKQRAYVLLDTSASMLLHFRFALAKAAVLQFLRRNRRELGEISLRTFDKDVGPLQTAADRATYDLLCRCVARQRSVGNGTCLERAILQACRDIREQRSLAGAEILVVTDGAARLDEGKIAAALGADVRLHCVKIGHAHVFATDAYVDEVLEYARATWTRRDQRIVQVRERRDKLRDALRHAHDDALRRGLAEKLYECDEERRVLAEELRGDYGHEIERLAHVYVEVADLRPEKVFALDAEKLASLERLVRELLAELEAVPTSPEALKNAALVLSHIALLRAAQVDPAVAERLDRLQHELDAHTEGALRTMEDHALESSLLSPADQRDLRILFGRSTQHGSPLWRVLLRLIRAAFARIRV